MSKGSAGDVGEDLLHDGVVTVLPFGLDQLERGVGEDGVVPPDGKQLILPGGRFLIELADPARRRGSGWRLCGQRLCGELWSGERVGSPSRMSSVREVMFSLVKTLRRW